MVSPGIIHPFHGSFWYWCCCNSIQQNTQLMNCLWKLGHGEQRVRRSCCWRRLLQMQLTRNGTCLRFIWCSNVSIALHPKWLKFTALDVFKWRRFLVAALFRECLLWQPLVKSFCRMVYQVTLRPQLINCAEYILKKLQYLYWYRK